MSMRTTSASKSSKKVVSAQDLNFKLGLNDSDGFWEDCFANKKEQENKSGEYITFNKSENLLKVQNKEIKDRMDKLMRTFDPDQKQKKENIRLQQGFEKCLLLHEKAKINNEINRLMFEKNLELKEKKELEECSFKPKLNNNRKADVKNFYERQMKWINRTQDKYKYYLLSRTAKNKTQIDNQTTHSFKPKLNKDYKPKQNKIPKTITSEISSKYFLERYNKARQEEEDRKKRVYRDLSTVLKDKWNARTARTASADPNNQNNNQRVDFRNLHNELHSIMYDEDSYHDYSD